MGTRIRRIFLGASLCVGFGVGQNIYVDAASGDNAAAGSTPATAVKTIQMGLYRAGQAGPTWTNILVTAGVYTPANGGLSNLQSAGVFLTNDSMRILGGWDPSFTSQVGMTELDGATVLGHVVYVSNADTITLDRLILRRGNAMGAWPMNCGGGLLVQYSSGGYYNLVISNNQANNFGGGFYLYQSHSNHLLARVNDNTGPAGGAGGFLDYCASNTIEGSLSNNRSISGNGGGLRLFHSSSNLLPCDLFSNMALGGGGVDIFWGNGNRITGSILGNTSTAASGGGVSTAYGQGNSIEGILAGNLSQKSGGGVSMQNEVACVVSAVIASNRALNAGAYFDRNGSGNRLSSVVLSNQTTGVGATVFLEDSTNFILANCVISNNGAPTAEILVVMSNGGGMNNVALSNNYFSGTSAAQAIALAEWGGNIASHTIISNGFHFASLGFLYSNATGGLISNFEVAALNQSYEGRHDAMNTWQNYLAPPPSTVYVDITNGNDANGGFYPANALKNIQKGIFTAVQSGSSSPVVLVAAGYYHSNNNGLSNLAGSGVLVTNHSVRLSGGWAPGTFAAQVGESCLDAAAKLNHVLFLSNISNVVIDGFLLSNGNAMGSAPHNSGGGALLHSVRSCSVRCGMASNSAVLNGGGFALVNSSSNEFEAQAVGNFASNGAGGHLSGSVVNSVRGSFRANLASTYGGGLFLESSQSNRITGDFDGNVGSGGGGVYLQSSGSNHVSAWFRSNLCAPFSGGGVKIQLGSDNRVEGTFEGNFAGLYGGALFADLSTNLAISGIFTGNFASNRGGGLGFQSSPGCAVTAVLSSNRTLLFGGGLYLSNQRGFLFSGSMVGGSASNGGGAFLYASTSNTLNGQFHSNMAKTTGGAVSLYLSHSNAITASMGWNVATNQGGAMNLASSRSNLITGPMGSNRTYGSGGALLMDNLSGCNAVASWMGSNSASNGGAAAVAGFNNVFTGTMEQNTALGDGGSLYLVNARSNFIGGGMSDNAAGRGGACAVIGGVSNLFVAAMESNRATGPGSAYFEQQGNWNRYQSLARWNTSGEGGTVFLQDATNFLLDQAFLSNNTSSGVDAILILSNNIGLNTAQVQSNRFFGSATASTIAIFETGNGTAGHALLGNIFYTNSLAFLYSNVSVGGDVISNHEIAVLNTPVSPRHDAALASNNSVGTALVEGMVYLPPVAAIISPAVAGTNGAVIFSSATIVGTRSVTNYAWTFGDGAFTQGADLASITHAYTAMLTNFVSLTVWDDFGASSTASNAIYVGGFVPIAGRVSGQTTNEAWVTLRGGNADVSNSTGTSGAGLFQFWVTNGAYALVPSKYGYRFSPANRSVHVDGSGSEGHDFTSREIIPILGFAGLTNRQEVVRDLPMFLTNDAPEMFTNGIAYWVSNAPGTAAYASNLIAAMGVSNALDTTLFQDGYYVLGARAIDSPFGRTNFLVYTLFFNNQIFKVLGKGLETKHALIYNTVRRLPAGDLVELFFHIEASQAVRIAVYDKRGRLLTVLPGKTYPKGPNRVTWENIPKNLEAGVYYARFDCGEFSKAVPIVMIQE